MLPDLMRYYFSLLLLITMAFGMGVLVGDNYAPISGATTAALTKRCVLLEVEVHALEKRVGKLEEEANNIRARVQMWLPTAEL